MPRWVEKTDLERWEMRCIPEPNSGCFLWLNKLNKDGYGSIELRNRQMSAHRFAYVIFKGPIPDNILVCHHCDVPCCVNPEHLFLGTDKDNRQDSIRKGRAYLIGQPQGVKHARAKFTETQVRAIRNDPRPQARIGKDYGVGQGTIGRVKRRERYGNVL